MLEDWIAYNPPDFFFYLWYDVKKYKSTSVHIDYIMVTL